MLNFILKDLMWIVSIIYIIEVTIMMIVLIPVRMILDIFERESIREGLKIAITAYLDYIKFAIGFAKNPGF